MAHHRLAVACYLPRALYRYQDSLRLGMLHRELSAASGTLGLSLENQRVSIKLTRQSSGTQFVIICGGMHLIGYFLRDASVTETSLTALWAVDTPWPCIIGRGNSK